jgi:hypothetical protein
MHHLSTFNLPDNVHSHAYKHACMRELQVETRKMMGSENADLAWNLSVAVGVWVLVMVSIPSESTVPVPFPFLVMHHGSSGIFYLSLVIGHFYSMIPN